MHVELLGLPRERAGVAALELDAANLNGDRFISDPGTRLGKGDSVLILSADAGG